ncbi:MAG TPA: ParB N-terminal domain-containing protein, partial [Longimicrobiales bacterium]|nr:ParB N-terminal domain-containing protein [Longimicrobiales bacterium]
MAMRRNLRRASYTPDTNIESYRPEDDGRYITTADRIHYIALRLIHPSRHQARRVTQPEADALLADDIDAHGLTHVPLLRPHPELPGEYEIVAGHRRVAALRRLANERRGTDVLRGTDCEPEGRRIPAVVREMDDLVAHATTVAENIIRESLRPWEQAVALHELRCALERQDKRASVRGVAAYLEVSHQ